MNDICIICLNEDTEIGLMDELIRPCNCKSSLVHRSCLNQWIQFKSNVLNKATCDICKAKYIYELDPNYKFSFTCDCYKILYILHKSFQDAWVIPFVLVVYIFIRIFIYSVDVCNITITSVMTTEDLFEQFKGCEYNIYIYSFITQNIFVSFVLSIVATFIPLISITGFIDDNNIELQEKIKCFDDFKNMVFDIYKINLVYSCILFLLTIILLPIFLFSSILIIIAGGIVLNHATTCCKMYRIKNLNYVKTYSTFN